MKVGIVVPHIFMQRDILPHVLFAPAALAIDLAEGVQALGAEVTLLTPGPVETNVLNITADLSYFERELAARGDTYIELLKKHPLTFITLARQVQSELVAHAFDMANSGLLDVVHIYTNEEDVALPFIKLCTRPVVLTHHDPFNFQAKYRSIFPKYKELNWLSLSYSQRQGMPGDTNWIDNIYHGIPKDRFAPNYAPDSGYFAYLGRIIKPKGLHHAIAAVKQFNAANHASCPLKIAGKHYSGHRKDTYWKQEIEPLIDGHEIQYVGFINTIHEKQEFLANARALIVPSQFDEPFGMVMLESLACGTPVIGLRSGAIPEVISHKQTGLLADYYPNSNAKTAKGLALLLDNVSKISRKACRLEFENRFTSDKMCRDHLDVYERLTALTK